MSLLRDRPIIAICNLCESTFTFKMSLLRDIPISMPICSWCIQIIDDEFVTQHTYNLYLYVNVHEE